MFKIIIISLFFKQIYCLIEVETRLGKVIGFNTKFEDQTLDVFYGLPYGKPPINELRFMRTSLVEKYNENPFYATKFSSHCPIMNESVLKGAPIKEDCLQLNIWRPSQLNLTDEQISNQNKILKHSNQNKISKDHNDVNECKKRYPVIMYFYGGVGSIFMLDHLKKKSIAYDGAPLSALGQMIMVTVNYRSGPFGNLYVPGKIEANVGFYDQALSIEFINKHIDSFCGDRNRITIFGNSLGSISVGFNLLSTYSNKFFNQAIMQSASPLYSQFTPDKPKEAYEKTIEFAENLNCIQMKRGKKSVDIECLKEVPLEEAQKYMFGFYNFPSLAGDFMNLKTKILYKTADILNIPKDKKILIGLVSNEVCVGGLDYLITRQIVDGNAPEISKREAQKSILTRLALLGQFNTEEMLKIAEFYTRDERNYLNSYYDSLDAITSDLTFNCPVDFFTTSATKSLPQNSVFNYVITKRPKTHYLNVIPSFNFTGVCHADELSYVFGQAFKDKLMFDDTDRIFSKELINTFAHFVHYGIPPNLTSSKIWPASDAKRERSNYVKLDLNSKEVEKFDFEIRCNDLWWRMFKRLLRQTNENPTSTKLEPKKGLYIFTIIFIVILILMISIALLERYYTMKRADYQVY